MPYLEVGDGHRLYYEQHGAADGQPAVVLHGGPGGGLQRSALQFFNLRKWRVTLFDQRGCGKSTPSATTPEGLRANTTWHLVADIERLRAAVGCVGPWTVFGGSWGSTLALAYTSRHPKAVAALVLRGVFLGEQWETDWLYGEGGASRMSPAEWDRFSNGGRRKTAKATMKYFGRQFRSRHAATRKAAVRIWNWWESALAYLKPQPHETAPASMALLEHHYFAHRCWLHSGQLLAAARHIKAPVIIVQGAYDLVCPPASAAALFKALPKGEKRMIMTHAGHAASEPATARALRKTTDSLLQ